MFVIFFPYPLIREKIRAILIPGVKICPLKGGSANCLSTFQRVNYESLTSDSPGKVTLSVNYRCPLINVSANYRVHCTIKRLADNKRTYQINLEAGGTQFQVLLKIDLKSCLMSVKMCNSFEYEKSKSSKLSIDIALLRGVLKTIIIHTAKWSHNMFLIFFPYSFYDTFTNTT